MGVQLGSRSNTKLLAGGHVFQKAVNSTSDASLWAVSGGSTGISL